MNILVVGASLKPVRYSNKAIKMLITYQHSVFAIGLRVGAVDGVNIDIGFPIYEHIDTVTLYLNPSRQLPYYDYIIGLKPRRVIFNPGTENPEFYELLAQNNIEVDVACTLVLLSSQQF